MKKIPYLLLLTIMLLSGCTTFVKEPVVTVKDVNVVSLDPTGAGMELYLNVKNMNSYDIRLQGYSYDLKVLALPLAKGDAREEIIFPAEGEAEFRIPIRITYNDLFELLKRQPDPNNIPYQLAAGFDLETPMGQMTVPIHRAGTYAIPKQFRPTAILNRVTDFLRLDR